MLTLTGTLLSGKYRVGSRLGSGGMGEVYEAVQEDLGRRVAIKVMSGPMANDPQLLERFKREALAVAALGHPHIVAVTDFQDNPGEPPFIVMERLVGESLGELLEREPMLEPHRAARIAEQTLSALAAAHESNLVHRDVKPDNIFLCRTDTNAELVKLLDFGVAKAMEATQHGKLTSTGAIVGTLVYMAPEQARGEPIDARADVYALGACLYHTLAGQPPFPPTNAARLLSAVCNESPTPLGMLRPDLDANLVMIVARAMARDQGQRYASARAMMSALGGYLRGEAPATDPMSATAFSPAGYAPMSPRTGGATPYGTPMPAPSTGPQHTPQPPAQYPLTPMPSPYAHPGSGGGVVVPPYGMAPSLPPPRRGNVALVLGVMMILAAGATLAGAAYYLKTHPGPKPVAATATTANPPPVEIVAANAQGGDLPTLAVTGSAAPHVVSPTTPTLVTTAVATTVNTPPNPALSGMGYAQLAGQMTKAFQSGDGKTCIEAYDKMRALPEFSDPANGYAIIRGDCLMEAGRCDEGRKILRDYYNQPRPIMQQMTPQQIDQSISSMAQMYCPPTQLAPPERVQRAQTLLYRAQSSKDTTQAAHYADEMAAQLPMLPRGTDEERHKIASYEYGIAKAYGDAGRCGEARNHFHAQCSINSPTNVDRCADALLKNTDKCKSTP